MRNSIRVIVDSVDDRRIEDGHDPESYHSSDGISHSAMRCFSQDGPWEYYARYEARTLHTPPTEPLEFGRVLHAELEGRPLQFVEIPETLSESVAVELSLETQKPSPIDRNAAGQPVLNTRKPSHRKWLEKWKADREREGLIVLDRGSGSDIAGIAEAVRDCHAFKAEIKVATNIRREVSGWAISRETGLLLRARADVLMQTPNGLTVVDYKSTSDSTPAEFVRNAIGRFGYHCQLAHYLAVFGAERALIVALRKREPHEAWCVELTPAHLLAGHALNVKTMCAIATKRAADDWHSDGWGAVMGSDWYDDQR